MADRLGLLHSTDPATPYLSLHCRTAATPAEIDAAFHVDRTLLRHTTIRRTVFAMPGRVVPLAHGSFNAPLVAKLRQTLERWIADSPDTDEDPATFLAATENAVIDALAAGGLTGNQLADAVPALQVTFEPAPGKPYSRPQRITSKVVEILAAEARIARGRPTGADFTSGAWTWELAAPWFDGGAVEEIDTATALAGLVSDHLAAFAPSTVTDLAWWTGLAKGKVNAALARLGAEEVTLDDGGTGFVLAEDPLVVADADAADETVALLPGLDSTVMGWKQRSWYVDDRADHGVFDRNGNAGPTIWHGGRVVGVWTPLDDGAIALDVFDDIGTTARAAIDDEAERIREWLGDVRVKWRYPTARTKALRS